MKAQKVFRASGMDMDNSIEYVDPNDLIEAFNSRSLGTDESEAGCITSIEGNEIVPHNLPAGKNKCIGARSFEDVDKAYYFLQNDGMHHRIEEYDYAQNIVTTIFENIKDSAGQDLLKYTDGSFVKDIELIDGRYLKFNDAVQFPKEVDVQRVRDGEYGVVTADDLNQIKKQPMQPVIAAYISNGAKNSNTVAKKLFQFKYKYIYWNNEESSDSMIGKRPVPEDETTPASVADVTRNNGISVSLKMGSNRVKEVVVMARYDLLDWFIVKTISLEDVTSIKNTELSIKDEIFESYDPISGIYSFVFYNDGLYPFEDVLDGDLMYDMLPDRANAMRLANGNVMLFAGIKEGKKRPTTNIELDVSYYDPNISITPTDLSNALNSTFVQRRPSNTHRRYVEVTMTGTPRTGDRIEMFVKSLDNGNVNRFIDYTVPASLEGNLIGVIEAMASGLYRYTRNGNTFSFNTESMWEMSHSVYTYANKITGESRSVHSIKSNSAYQVGLAYRDEYGKLFPLQSNSNTILNTGSIAQTSGLIPEFVWRILDEQAPDGAVDYQWVVSPNNTHQSFLQINGQFKGIAENSYIDISLSSIIKFNRANPSSQISYEFSPGDRCTFISKYMDGETQTFFDTKLIDVDVISFKPVAKSDTDPTAVDYILRVRRPTSIDLSSVYDGRDNLVGKEIVVEIYSPKKSIDGKEAQVYYEIGEVYPIIDGRHTVLSGTIREADVYFKTREMELSSVANKFLVFEMEDSNFSDFYKSNYYSFGRPRSYYDTPEEIFLKASVRYSDTYNKYTNNNGLTRFFKERLVDYDEIYGAIWYLEQRDNSVICVQQLKVGYIPILQSILEDQAAQENVSVSDQLLNKIRYSRGNNIGIGNAIKSYTSYGSNVYFIDPNRCEPVRVGLDGVVSISKKMSKYFKKIIREIYGSGGEITGFYDVYNNEYIVSFTLVDGRSISIPIEASSWRVTDTYVVDPSQIIVDISQKNGTASYDNTSGIATFTPANNFIGDAALKFRFSSNGDLVERGECIKVSEGELEINPIYFMDKLDVPIGSDVVSNKAEISGINTVRSIIVLTGKMRVNGGVWSTGSVSVNDGDVIELLARSSSLASSNSWAEIQYNDIDKARFNVRTVDDTLPDDYSFGIKVDAEFDSLNVSTEKTISGITVPVPISVVGGEYSINGGPFTSLDGQVSALDRVRARVVASHEELVTSKVTITIGEGTGTYEVKTRALKVVKVNYLLSFGSNPITPHALVINRNGFVLMTISTEQSSSLTSVFKERDTISLRQTSLPMDKPWILPSAVNLTVKNGETEIFNRSVSVQSADLQSTSYVIPTGSGEINIDSVGSSTAVGYKTQTVNLSGNVPVNGWMCKILDLTDDTVSLITYPIAAPATERFNLKDDSLLMGVDVKNNNSTTIKVEITGPGSYSKIETVLVGNTLSVIDIPKGNTNVRATIM